ncbi:MAG TPA: response regulator [Gemmatimonadales bacterium]|nr:response regulator [Gemmatimonadales bacterium]
MATSLVRPGGAVPGTEKVNILLVDDQPGKLLAYEAMLAQLGENLIKASSGREALEHLLKHDVTVVLMDVSMPEIDGFELAEMIRAHPRHQKTAIIFVSAVHLTDLDKIKGYETGAVDYVSVPVIPELLRAKLSVFIELYRKRVESERLTTELERRVAARTAELEAAIAKQTELTAQLTAADRRKDEFLALLAHELRNPLAPVQNAVAIMQRKAIDDPDLRWCRDVIERQTRQSARLVDDLLDVARVTQGKITLRQEPLALASIVHGAVETSRPLIDSRQHQLQLDLSPEPIWVRGDAARLTQVLANLLNNAAKFQDKGGRIELTVQASRGEAVVRVRDHGAGMAPEMLREMFQLFVQGGRDSHASNSGLGIGLFLVRHLVELHAGSVEIHSDGPGLGTECVVRLPLLDSPEPRRTPAPGLGAVDLRGRKVLVVDDNRDAAQSLALLLRLQGHEVTVAHDGPSAISRTTEQPPEVILLDLGLPGMDGYEVCRRLRRTGFTSTRIIAMTGWGQERDRRRSEEAGFDSHTVKPVEIHQLERLLQLG